MLQYYSTMVLSEQKVQKAFFDSSPEVVYVPGNKTIMFRHFYPFLHQLFLIYFILCSLYFLNKIDIKLFRLEYMV
ncbi:MAG: hypothetical protein QG646_2121 [Euryarchaeota archaeon]|nr:hypothetical protein [Euryarchaeota archaeon]